MHLLSADLTILLCFSTVHIVGSWTSKLPSMIVVVGLARCRFNQRLKGRYWTFRPVLYPFKISNRSRGLWGIGQLVRTSAMLDTSTSVFRFHSGKEARCVQREHNCAIKSQFTTQRITYNSGIALFFSENFVTMIISATDIPH